MKIVFGIDEVGRGPLAGPVVACSVLAPSYLEKRFCFLRDSKKMTPRQREEVFNSLKQFPEVKWALGRVSEKVIDRINIYEATKLAMQRSVLSLEKKTGKANLLLIDGNMEIDLRRNQKAIVRGDEKIFLIKLASIIAKVGRDRLMERKHLQYPVYGFNKHKGYGTKEHYKALLAFGPSKIHRLSFNLGVLQT